MVPLTVVLPCVGAVDTAMLLNWPLMAVARLIGVAVLKPMVAFFAATVGAGGFTLVNTTDCVPLPTALEALTVAVNVPVALGMPLIRPVVVFTARPPGRPLALNPVGAFCAVIW